MKKLALVGVGAALLVSLAGCAAPKAESLSIREASPAEENQVNEHYSNKISDHEIAVTIYGSSSCPPAPMEALAFEDSSGQQYVDIELEPDFHNVMSDSGERIICTADYAPHVFIVESSRTLFSDSVETRIAESTDANYLDYENSAEPENPPPGEPPVTEKPDPVEPSVPTEKVEPPVETLPVEPPMES